MKRGKLLSIISIVVMLVSVLTFSSEVYATSRTTTLEVAGTSRIAPTDGPQVLGQRRDGVISEEVSVGKVTNTEALNVLKDMVAVADIVNNVIVNNSDNTDNVEGLSIPTEQFAVLDSIEITAKPGVEVSEKNPLYISFSFPGVVTGTKVFVLHFENGKWVVVPSEIVNGIIIAKFTSLSPVAVVVDKTTLGSSVLGANRAKSPRTGDSIYMIVAICVAGAVISSVVAYKAKKRV